MVATQEFSVSHSRYLRMLAASVATVPLSILAVLVLAASVAAWFDIRWLIVALMAVTILLPMLAAFLYFNYGLREEGFVNVFPHTLSFSPGEIVAKAMFPTPEEAKEPEEKEDPLKLADERWEKKWAPYSEEREEPEPEPEKPGQKGPQRPSVCREYRFAVAKPMRYRIASDGIIIPLAPPHRGALYVPYSAFASTDDFKLMIETMN